MKILIAYASKSGTCRECAERLQKELRGMNVTLADLAKSPPPKLEDFDLLILGAPVRFGKLEKSLRELLSTQKEAVLSHPHALFYCCGLQHESDRYYDVLFPEEIKESAFQTACFGGTLRYQGLNLLEKLFIRIVRNKLRESAIEDGEYTPTLPGILPETIGKTATFVRVEAEKIKTALEDSANE